MNPLNPTLKYRYLIEISVLAEVFFAFWTTIVSRTCSSDGCLAVAMIGAIAIAIYLFQVIVLIPIYAFCRKRAGQAYLKNAFSWLSAVTLILLVPMLLMKGGWETLLWVLEYFPVLIPALFN